ncbi:MULTISPECIES: pteridine-dependent deoxygenase [unclassified Rudaea]|uniref:chorismate transformation enzyme, FkbO/Hyg5 family n=1 Tax=unclassified Rudaea TaxID=2627037 RepID=UPI0020163337|nr:MULTISPECIES: pteridine-dependent deoxygenase [unclassified Rudaea]
MSIATPHIPAATPHAHAAELPPLRVAYESTPLDAILAGADVLAVFGFGTHAPAAHADPRYLRVNLEPADGEAPFEVWRVRGPVRAERRDGIAWAEGDDYAYGAIEVDESAHGDVEGAAEFAYRCLVDAIAASAKPHTLRIWNYLDAINLGAGDAERYRRFCVGRAAGLAAQGFADDYPAATGIGVRDGRRVLQIYWLAARTPGTAFENPRQVSAWRYPRQYGIKAPTFARAMRAPTQQVQVYISGTAAIVGHVSHHHDDFAKQLDETLANIDSVLAAAQVAAAARLDAGAALKAYVRRAEDLDAARRLLGEKLPAQTPTLFLLGDICRSELLVEIDGIQGA